MSESQRPSALSLTLALFLASTAGTYADAAASPNMLKERVAMTLE